jgi:hypothetical protein
MGGRHHSGTLGGFARNPHAGQYDRPIRVDAYNVLAGRAWDASRDIARLIAERCEDICLPPGVLAFCQRNGVLPDQAA